MCLAWMQWGAWCMPLDGCWKVAVRSEVHASSSHIDALELDKSAAVLVPVKAFPWLADAMLSPMLQSRHVTSLSVGDLAIFVRRGGARAVNRE
jgi:hypothetical protein